MIVVRNRLIALIYRILALGVLLTSLIFYWTTFKTYTYAPICYFDVEAGLFYCAILFIAAGLNAFDLRRGISGLASSVYMPLSLAGVAYCLIGGILGLGYLMPVQGVNSLGAIIYFSLLIAIPLGEWIGFEPKGSIRLYTSWTWMIYPVLYFVFCLLRVYIFPDAPVVESNAGMYPYAFYNPQDQLFFVWILVVFGGTVLLFGLLIICNDILGLKFKKKHDILLN